MGKHDISQTVLKHAQIHGKFVDRFSEILENFTGPILLFVIIIFIYQMRETVLNE